MYGRIPKRPFRRNGQKTLAEHAADHYRNRRYAPLVMQGLVQDIRFACRMLAKDRRFTLAAVLALGLGIGVNTAVFGVINAAVIRDMPFDEPDRLVVGAVAQAPAAREPPMCPTPTSATGARRRPAFDGLAAEAGHNHEPARRRRGTRAVPRYLTSQRQHVRRPAQQRRSPAAIFFLTPIGPARRRW